MNPEIYVTADTHFFHANIIKHCNRPFKNVWEMNEVMIDNWNRTIPVKNSWVYILGDYVWRNKMKVIEVSKRLNGQKFLVRGNHDFRSVKGEAQKCFQWIKDLYELKLAKTSIIMCHYPMRSWPRSHHGSYHFYGHTHKLDSIPERRTFNVGVDLWDYRPLHIEELVDNNLL